MGASLDVVASYIPALARRRLMDLTEPVREPEIERFEAAVLLADVSGFTVLTETLAHRGPEGAEEMTNALNSYFGQLIELIAAHGGDVVKFAGDAMLVLWPREEGKGELADLTVRAAQCALALQREAGIVEAVPGAPLSLHAAISAGSMSLLHVGGMYGRWEFVVAGEALAGMGHAVHQSRPGEVVLTPEAWGVAGTRARGDLLDEGCVRLTGISSPLDLAPLPALDVPPEAEAALRSFLPGAIRARLEAGQTAWLSELRKLTVLFVNLPDLDHKTSLEDSQALMHALQAAVYRYEGSINKMSVDEKGTSLIAVLGLPPLSHADDPTRGIGVALGLKAKLADLGFRSSIGITSGRAFCGEVGNSRRREYTVMGDIINLAARLMQAADGEIRCDAATYQAAEKAYAFEGLPAIPLKGKTGLFTVFKPLGKLSQKKETGVGIVGRMQERIAIGDALKDLRYQFKSGSILIEGEAGMGKSSLLAYASSQAFALRIRTLVGEGDAVERTTPYQAWKPVFADIFGLSAQTSSAMRSEQVRTALEAHPDDLARASLLNPVLGTEFPDGDLVARLDDQARARMGNDLLVRILGRVAEAGHLLLILDDVHWMDSASWELALQVTRKVTRCLVVLASRPVAVPPPPEVATLLASGLLHLRLEAVSNEETELIACRALGTSELPGGVLALIRDRAGGHPLFIEELVQALRQAGVLLVEGEACRLKPGADLLELNLPATVEGLIMSRIDGLPPPTQFTMKVASAVGRTFDAELLREIFPIHAQRHLVGTYLADLVRECLTGEDDAEGSEDRPRRHHFKSAVIRDVAYNLMLYSQRKEIHRSIAEWYEAHHAGDDLAPLLAYHWNLADEPGRAVDYCVTAGRQAQRNFAYLEAAGFFEDALACDERLGERGDPGRRLALKQWLGQVYKGMARQQDARRHLEDALGLAAEAGDPGAQANVLGSLGHLHYLAGDLGLAQETLERAAERARAADDVVELLRNLQFIARVHYKAGRPDQAVVASRAALEAARSDPRQPDASAHLAFLGMLHTTSAIPGLGTAERMKRGVAFLEEAAAARRSLGERMALNDSLNLLANAQWVLGDYARAADTFSETLTITTEMGLKYDEICAVLNLAIVHHEMGKFAQMQQFSRRALADAVAGNYPDYEILARLLGALSQVYLGAPARGLREFSEARDRLGECPVQMRRGLATTFLPYAVELLQQCGQLSEARKMALEALQLQEETGIREYEQRLLTLAGELDAEAGDPDQARSRFDAALALGEEIGSAGTIARAQCGIAGLLLRIGRREEARGLLELAHEAAFAISATLVAGLAALALGDLAISAQDPPSAQRWYKKALDHSMEASCRGLECRARLGLARSAPDGAGSRNESLAVSLLESQLEGLAASEAEAYRGRWAVALAAYPGSQ